MKRRHVFLLLVFAVAVVATLVYVGRLDRHSDAEPDRLHTDDDIQRVAPHDIAAATESARSLLDVPWLDVVPAGSTRPRREVFQVLGLDDSRVREFRTTPIDHVVFLRWQVSPSYDVVCMTGSDDWEPCALSLADPERPVYGVRFVSRAEGRHLIW
jgi:hypothetical protein